LGVHARAGIAGALAAAALTLASCGGDQDVATTTAADTGAIAGVDTEACAEVEYGGEGEPEALIISDLPMRGDSAVRSEQQVEAIRIVLEQNDWQAGGEPVAFQACDDTIEKTELWDPATCRSNAEAYAGDDRVLGVIGTYNSGCAAEQIPILNEAGVAMVSPGNTAVCLTQPSETCEDYDPDSLYGEGERNYARVVPNDAFQGAALVEFAREQGAKKPFVLYAADDPTSTGQASTFRNAAEQVGLEVAGYETWDPEANDYVKLFQQVLESGADAVVLAGLTDQNGGKVIDEKVFIVGPNDKIPLLAFDGFTQQATIEEAAESSEGMFASITGRAPEELSGAGQELVSELEARISGSDPVELYAPYAGEAAQILLDAIAEAGGERAEVPAALLATERSGGILGSYEIEDTGDPSVGPVTIFEAGETFKRSDEVTPDEETVAAAGK